MDAIHLPNAITLPTTFGAPGTPLQAGQVVQALVLELIQSDVFRLQLPQAVVDVRTEVPLTPGSTITLAVKGTGANARLTIYADDPKSVLVTPAATNVAPPSLAGKQPVGEAVVVARAPAAQPGRAPEAPARVAEPVIREAPSIAPARQPDVVAPRNVSVSPQQALGEAMRVAAARQTGSAPLLADVEQLVQAPQTLVPEPVRAAAQQVLALRVPLDEKLTASRVKQAFVRSGILLEPRLAADTRALSSPAMPPSPGTAIPGDAFETPAPSADLKAALIVFRQVLKTWVVDTAPSRSTLPATPPASPAPAPVLTDPAAPARPALSDVASLRQLASALAGAPQETLPAAPLLSPEQATTLAKTVASALIARDAPDHPAPHPNGPPPPYRSAPLSAQQPALPTIAPDMPAHETAERLLAATDGALARTTLLQAASLPEQANAQRIDPAAQRWTFEVPFATPQGTAIAQFEVSRDGRGARQDPLAPVWRARFSLDVEPMGPVHALVTLAGERTSVTLWAERAETASRLNENVTMLSEALRAAELEPADFQFRVGVPPAIARQAAPGRFMDRAT